MSSSSSSPNNNNGGEKKKVPKPVHFLFGGLAGSAATCVVQPIDLLKNRLQLQGEGGAARQYGSSFQAAVAIARAEGLTGLYSGLSAGIFRQATYTTGRLGVYSILSEYVAPKDGQALPFWKKALVASAAGASGAVVGTPAEVCLVRMTSDGRLPRAEQRGYAHVFDALGRIAKEEGVLRLWSGVGPTVARAALLNMAQLASYSQAKETLLKTGFFADNIVLHSSASLVSGFLATLVSMPADLTKTRIQTQKWINGKPQYTGAIDCLVKAVRTEGLFSLWKGFTPYFARLGPHTILTFVFMEKLFSAAGYPTKF